MILKYSCRLYIPLSAAFLGSLAVTVRSPSEKRCSKSDGSQVLIVYVMNPPVRDAIQGAFLVGTVVSGFVFGVLAVVFPEVTEGLGCLLGGFCLAMWLLVLKPGGLVTSGSGKAIFISAFCVGVYALSFSHYTRPITLMVSTSLAGATAIVLGVDCFSRAGLKEFWLYVWGKTFRNAVFYTSWQLAPVQLCSDRAGAMGFFADH